MGSYNQAVARLLTQGMPEKQGDCVKTLEAMPELQQHALAAAYLYSRKVPQEDQQDVFQELVSRLLDALSRQEGPILYPKAYTLKVARCGWIKWLKHRERHIPIEEVEDTLVDSGEIEADWEAQQIWRVLPANIQDIIRKRLNGQPNTGAERKRLWKYLQKHGDYIRDLAGLPHSYGKRKDEERYRGYQGGLMPSQTREAVNERVRRHREKRKKEKEIALKMT